MPFNGPIRELYPDDDYLEESVYCTRCGSIFVPAAGRRDCPACTLAERLQELTEEGGGR